MQIRFNSLNIVAVARAMGAWGTGIFSDDLACDVRQQYRELVADGLSSTEATEKLCAEYSHVIAQRDDEGPAFWIALAAAQWQCGRLVPLVKQKAIEVIDSGGDLHRWNGAATSHYRRRQAVLAKLRSQLLLAQRSPTRLRKPYFDRTDWEIGHAIGYRTSSGRWILLRVVDITEDRNSRVAVVELCDWGGYSFPSPTEIEQLPTRECRFYTECLARGENPARFLVPSSRMAIYALRPRHFPKDRVKIVATGLKLKPKPWDGGMYFGGWKKLDEHLLAYFGVE